MAKTRKPRRQTQPKPRKGSHTLPRPGYADSQRSPSQDHLEAESTTLTDRFSKMFAPPELYDPKKRAHWRLVSEIDGRGPYVIELNLQHIDGLKGAAAALCALHAQVVTDEDRKPVPIGSTYFTWRLSVDEWRRLLKEDDARASRMAANRNAPRQQVQGRWPLQTPMMFRAIYKLWPDFPVKSHVFRSIPTIKADAAAPPLRTEREVAGMFRAIVDSGVDATHPRLWSSRKRDAGCS